MGAWRQIARGLILFVLLLAFAPNAMAAPQQQPSTTPCAVAVAAAMSKLNSPYVWGAKGPLAFDCSGLTYWAYQQAGLNIGLSTYNQIGRGSRIPCTLADMAADRCWQPGDLIFARSSEGQHVSLYIGGGRAIDAYHPSTGVIITQPAQSSYYQAHFWQGRRMVDCGGDGAATGGVDTLVIIDAGGENLPDLLQPVSVIVPQCGECIVGADPILPYRPWDGQWPSGANALNIFAVAQASVSWLAWSLSELARQMLCWFLQMLALLVGALLAMVNTVIAGINGLYQLLLMIIITSNNWAIALWQLLDELRLQIASIDFSGITLFIDMIFALLISLIGIVISIGLMVLSIVLSIVGVLSYIGAIAIAITINIRTALTGTTIPAPLQSSPHIYYQTMRGIFDAILAGPLAWLYYLMVAMIYVAWIWWLGRFLNAERSVE